MAAAAAAAARTVAAAAAAAAAAVQSAAVADALTGAAIVPALVSPGEPLLAVVVAQDSDLPAVMVYAVSVVRVNFLQSAAEADTGVAHDDVAVHPARAAAAAAPDAACDPDVASAAACQGDSAVADGLAGCPPRPAHHATYVLQTACAVSCEVVQNRPHPVSVASAASQFDPL